jgi:dUTP pyrophosphatase
MNTSANWGYFTSASASAILPVAPVIDCRADRPELIPVRAHPTDAGADLKSRDAVQIYPGEQAMVRTGVSVKIPSGYAGFVFNRSSQGRTGITIPHSVGVIDSDYRGEILVVLKNTSEDVYTIKPGDRIAQLVIIPVVLANFKDTWNDTVRGTGGFGSTGV